MQRAVPTRVSFLLFLLFFFGLALNVLAFVDLHWTQWLLARADIDSEDGDGAPSASVDATQADRLRTSILNVRVARCAEAGENLGTGFVVKAGYVATAAHLLGDHRACGGVIRLIDANGREHRAALDGVSIESDLAVLQISDHSLPSLELADSQAYERPGATARLVTIGYPLEQTGVPAQAGPAVSNEGSLARYDPERDVFVTSGLDLDAGNGGGPIFLRETWRVLGIVRTRPDPGTGEDIAYVAPIGTFTEFFRQKTGQGLP